MPDYWKQQFGGIFHIWGSLLLFGLLIGIGIFTYSHDRDLVEVARDELFEMHAHILSGRIFVVALIFSVFLMEATMHTSRKNDFLDFLQGSGKEVATATLVAHAIFVPFVFAALWLFMPIFGFVFYFLISVADLAGKAEAVSQFGFDGLALTAMLIVQATTYLLAFLPFGLFLTVLYDAPEDLVKKTLFVLHKKILHVVFLVCYIIVYMRYHAMQLHMLDFESFMWQLLLPIPAAAIMLYLPFVSHSCYRIAVQPDKMVFRDNKKYFSQPNFAKSQKEYLKKIKRFDKACYLAVLVLLPATLVYAYMP